MDYGRARAFTWNVTLLRVLPAGPFASQSNTVLDIKVEYLDLKDKMIYNFCARFASHQLEKRNLFSTLYYRK